MTLTLAQNAERIKNCIDKRIDPTKQKILVDLYKTTLGSILTECINLNDDLDHTTYGAKSVSWLLDRSINNVYELHKALYTAKQYHLPYECKDVINDALNNIEPAVKPCAHPRGTTESTGWNNDYFHVMMNGLDTFNIYEIMDN